MPDHGTPTITPGRELALLILGGIVTVLVLIAAAWVLFGPRPANGPDDNAAARPVPTVSPQPTPVTTPTASIAPGTPRPAACADIYSPEMKAAFGDLVLNPEWTAKAGAAVGDGAEDPQLVAVIQGDEHLSCRWASPTGPSDSGVSTSVVWVTAEQSAAVEARLRALDFECYEELGGLRCITETNSTAGTSGESHFLRDGIWLATHFVNAGPDGYTHDMINTIWAGQ